MAAKASRKLNNANRRQYKYFLMFSGISLLGFALFYAYPLIRTLTLSFTDKEILSFITNFVGFDNYARALQKDPLFWLSLKHSFIFAFSSGVLILITSLLLALLLNMKIKCIALFRVIYFLPFIIPAFAVGAVYKNIFDPRTGLINTIIRYFGGAGPGWYKSPDTALLTMIIISSFGFGPKMVIFLAALQNIPENLYEAAKIEGAGSLAKFFKITLPLITPVVFFNVVLITIDGLKAFSLAFVMGNGQGWPANSTLLFPIYLFINAFNSPYRLGYASAMAWLFFVVLLALTLLNFALSKLYVVKDVD